MLAATLELGEPMSLRVNTQTLELHRGKTLQVSW
jgi:hypothetical protein